MRDLQLGASRGQFKRKDCGVLMVDKSKKSKKKQCSFSLVHVIEFELQISPCSVPQVGFPIGLSPVIRRQLTCPIDIYEDLTGGLERQEFMKLGYLDENDRVELLSRAAPGILTTASPRLRQSDIDASVKQCDQIRQNRIETLRPPVTPAPKATRPKPCDLFSFLARVDHAPKPGLADMY